MPLELRRWWSFWPNYTDVDPASTTICVDGEIGTVLKTYREVNMPHMKRSSAEKVRQKPKETMVNQQGTRMAKDEDD